MMNNPNLYSPRASPQALPPGVDVKISYAGRTGCSMAFGGIFFALAIYIFIATLLRGPIESSLTSLSCKELRDDASCADRMVPGGLRIPWTVKNGGTYRLTLQSTPTRALELDTGAGKKLRLDAGKDGPDATIEMLVNPGDYSIQVTDPPSVSASAAKPFKVYVELVARMGEDPPSVFAKAGPVFYVMLVMALLFLGIPLLFVEEKKQIPLRIDASGVTMRNGARYPWNEFGGVQPVVEVRKGHSTEVATALNFARGRAVVRYRPITNKDEVMPIVRALQQGRNPFA